MEHNSLVIQVNGTQRVLTVENCGKLRLPHTPLGRPNGAFREAGVGRSRRAAALRACSACAGDYEDPDRTAWTPDEDSEQEGRLPEEVAEEFPVEE
jgi:hypothetical protein